MKRMVAIGGGIVVLAGFLGQAGGDEKSAATPGIMQKAYANGALAKAQCEAFAAKADEEGFKAVAALMRASARAEGIHLEKYAGVLKALGAEPKSEAVKPEVGSTKENLEALSRAVDANAVTYAAFVTQVEADKNSMAVMFLKGTLADEASRGKLYKQALRELEAWRTAGREFIVCTVCGFTTMDSKLRACPVCTAPRSKFDDFK